MTFLTSTVTMVGNVTRAPELRFTPSGTAVATFGVALNDRKKDADGNWEDDTSFIDCVVFAELAENVVETIEKGARIQCTGRLKQNRWTTPEGDKRSKVEVIIEAIGPELRWATATVQRTENPNGGGHDSAAGTTTRRPQQAQQRPAASSDGDPGPAYEYDEEPF